MTNPRLCSISVVAALLVASAASAQSRFATVPSAGDMASAYPSKALTERVGGRATISCAVTPDARLADCSVKSETPQDFGFGAAALTLAAKIVLTPQNLPSEVDIPLRFEPPVRRVAAVFHSVQGGYDAFGPAGPYYPERAARMGAQGYAVLACHAAESGGLTGCTAVEDAPSGFGFREAALKLVERKVVTAPPVMAPESRSESEVVEVVVPFRLGRK